MHTLLPKNLNRQMCLELIGLKAADYETLRNDFERFRHCLIHLRAFKNIRAQLLLFFHIEPILWLSHTTALVETKSIYCQVMKLSHLFNPISFVVSCELSRACQNF